MVTKTYFTITLGIDKYEPLVLYFGKDCSEGTVMDQIKEAIYKEEETFGFLAFLFWMILFILMLFIIVCILNVCVKSMTILEAIPLPYEIKIKYLQCLYTAKYQAPKEDEESIGYGSKQ